MFPPQFAHHSAQTDATLCIWTFKSHSLRCAADSLSKQPNSNVSLDAFSAAPAFVRCRLSSATEKTTVATTRTRPIVVRTDKCCRVDNPRLFIFHLSVCLFFPSPTDLHNQSSFVQFPRLFCLFCMSVAHKQMVSKLISRSTEDYSKALNY